MTVSTGVTSDGYCNIKKKPFLRFEISFRNLSLSNIRRIPISIMANRNVKCLKGYATGTKTGVIKKSRSINL